MENKSVASIFDEELTTKEEELAAQFGAIEEGQNTFEIISEEPEIEIDENIEFITEHKKKTKKDLITDILELQAKAGGNEFTESILKKQRKDELEKILALSFEKLTKKNVEKKQTFKKNENSIVVNLFIANVILAGLLEKGGDILKDRTENINLLEGLKEEFQQNEDELKQILSRVYDENAEIINKYVSPLTLYYTFLLRSVGTTAISNLKKKKAQQNEEQEKSE